MGAVKVCLVWGVGPGAGAWGSRPRCAVCGPGGLGLSGLVSEVFSQRCKAAQERRNIMLDQIIVAAARVVRPVKTVAEEILLEEAKRYSWTSVEEAAHWLRNAAMELGCSRGRAREIVEKHAIRMV